MNILNKLLPSFLTKETEEETGEFDEAKARAERISFHRDHVRNGPVKFKTVSTGQERRARQRELDRQTKKARRRQVRQHLAGQREAATVRAYLQGAGVLPSWTDMAPDQDRAVESITWIVAHFAPVAPDGDGKVEVTYKLVIDSLTAALNRWQELTGQPTTKLSPAYRLPVALADGVEDEALDFARRASQA